MHSPAHPGELNATYASAEANDATTDRAHRFRVDLRSVLDIVVADWVRNSAGAVTFCLARGKIRPSCMAAKWSLEARPHPQTLALLSRWAMPCRESSSPALLLFPIWPLP